MRRLLIALAILLVLLLIGDFVAKAYATDQLEDRVKNAVRGATSSSASISSFPFLGRLLVFSDVDTVSVSVGPVIAERVTFASIAVDLHGVRVDRNRLIREQEVRLTGLDSGTVTAEITDAEISRLAGVQVRFASGQVRVRTRGVDVNANISMANGNLVLGGSGVSPLRLRIPRAPLLPCDATTAVVKQGRVAVSCTVNRVPPELAGVTVRA